MLYTKVRIEDKWNPKRLYRVVLLKGNPRLSILGAVFGFIFEASFEHYFMFRTKKESFVANSWLYQFGDNENEKSISFTCFNDLDSEFEYEYDTGEGYEFKCKKYKSKIEVNRDELEEDYPDVIVIEGKGLGIFENNHMMLDDYLSGEISGDFSEKDCDEENYYEMPYNLDMDKLSDFDRELDLEYYEMYYENVEYIAKRFDDEIIDEPLEFNEDDKEFADWMTRSEVAYDIFNNEKVNTTFRELIKFVDISEAYELLYQKYKELDELDEENDYSDEEYDRIFEEKIDSLIKH